jgi:hypothetical protein
MTMPKTALVLKTFAADILPEELSDGQLAAVIAALRSDLPGDPIEYIEHVAPHSERCQCGAVHLAVNAPDLSSVTAASLHRLLATPYGDMAREHMRRSTGFKTIRFGWDGIAQQAPMFVQAVAADHVGSTASADISNQALERVVQAIRLDIPQVVAMLDASAANGTVHAVSAKPGVDGHVHWTSLIDQLMFAWSTPIRKYMAEWLRRTFGVYGGAINCCIVMSGRYNCEADWRRAWTREQTQQQLTPDC